MTASTLTAELPSTESGAGLSWVMAWRNLWRNPRRTWLTAGGIAFACLLVGFSMALQAGSYGAMIESATGFYMGQAQLSRGDFVTDGRLEQTITDAQQLLSELQQLPGVRAAPRVRGFALASVGERSFAGLVHGVDFAAEAQVVTFFDRIVAGDVPQRADQAVIGVVMARNLGAQVGDELVLLGTAKEGGVAALAVTISGLFDSGQVEVDRSFVFAPLATVQEGFALGDELHTIVLRYPDIDRAVSASERVASQLPRLTPIAERLVVRPWQSLLPEVVQSIELDRVSARLFYGAILIIVTFSVINTFIMIVFERTREFGMLLALGMRPLHIAGLVQIEALMMWALGAGIGLLLGNGLIAYLASVGIPIAGMEEFADQLYLSDRIYPALSWQALVTAPLTLLVGTQAAAALATWRVRRLRPVEALRAE